MALAKEQHIEKPFLSDKPANPLTGLSLGIVCFFIGFGNFLVVLDSTIANVSIPTISGNLGVSATQGTWLITSYAVAEAITVPLTGWLSKTFGSIKVFITCYFAFGLISLFCGMATSLNMLILGRVLLGLAGGPIMPSAQTLLIRILPNDKVTLANVIFAMTTLIGPIIGPTLGGIICDNYHWGWIFYINVFMSAIGGVSLIIFLRGQIVTTVKANIDKIGLFLLIVWVGSLQIMLDEGRNHDWFAADEIKILAIMAIVGFIAFLIWELTDENPIVNLRIFKNRPFVIYSLTHSLAFGAFFATIVILPLWLQENMGYTATWAGYAASVMGILAMIFAPIVGKSADKIDPRLIVCIGILGLGSMTFWRVNFTSQIPFFDVILPTFLSGPFMVMFFIPINALALSCVSSKETADAAGLYNFMRTMAGAIATALVQTSWDHAERINQTEIVGAMKNTNYAISQITSSGAINHEGAIAIIGRLVGEQSLMLATIDVFLHITVIFIIAAMIIWFAPKPKGPLVLDGPTH